MKSHSFVVVEEPVSFIITFAFLVIASIATVSASIIAPTPAAALEKRQASSGSSASGSGPGQFSIGSLDPSLSSLFSQRLQSASSIAASHSTIAFTSVSSSACPQGGQLPNGECCTSGTVIAGKCFQGTSSSSSTAPAQTTTQRQGDAATSLRFNMSNALLVSLFSAFFLGFALILA
ncbi:uncharacterized protein FA14DRAFT_177922 [Meira miltonrushii]|uniref:Uncharacterized protein n=1 Tax=Meira miltonrushii TaxID=1280837 RepID=A0A316VAH6_9BASI|nr:uncharacterized protein FA14DRAFT_177922 [Meira miltonrushii]PWN34516.1 hypothetical protein FA14DRAFT_177922 [Meira miltonrushii]